MLYDSFFKEIFNPDTVPDHYIHRFRQRSDTGMELELIQEFVLIPLDIFFKFHHNKGIRTELEGWLTFLGSDRPEDIITLVGRYPYFKALYEDIYTLCLNTEKVMQMFSKELLELDRNTVQYMIDEMQEEIDGMQEQIETMKSEYDAAIADKDAELETLRKRIAELEA